MALLKWSSSVSLVALVTLLLSIAYNWPSSIWGTAIIGLAAGIVLVWIGLVLAIFMEA